MAYERLNLTTGDPLDEGVFKHIEDGIEQGARCFNDLYDEKVDESFDKIYETCNIKSPSYRKLLDYGAFSGVCACIGNPAQINTIKFPAKARTGSAISEASIIIFEIPEKSDITINADSGPRPTPLSWVKLGQTSVALDSPITDDQNYSIITAEFSETIINSENKYLVAFISFATATTIGLIEKNIPDIEYNPWYYYTSGGSQTSLTPWPSGYVDDKNVLCLPIEVYSKTVSDKYSLLNTSAKGKFFNLVNDCINNSESFGTLFEEKYNPHYTIGSVNLVAADTSTSYNEWGTFTGCCWYIGEVPEKYESDGVSLSIYSRSLDGSDTPITKVYAYLYAVDDVPLLSEKPSFASLNPVLLCSGNNVDVNIKVDTSEVVTIWWDKPFVNTEGKKLMLAYNTNSYSSRRQTGKLSKDFCSELDGNSYTETLFSYYATGKGYMSGGWGAGWEDKNAKSWCFVTKQKIYDFGEKFYNILDEALQSTAVQTAPSSEVNLASQYDVVVGDTFQLFYEGVVKTFSILNEGIRVKCDVGQQYPRYYQFTPNSTHSGKTYTLTLSTRRLDGTIISEGTTKIVVHPKLTNETTATNLNVLLFGDSLTGGGLWCSEGLRRIYGQNTKKTPLSLGVTNQVTTYGAVSNSNNPYYNNSFPVNHEGHSGWTWGSFLAKSSSSSTTSQMIIVLNSNHGYNLLDVQKSSWVDNNGLVWEVEDLPSENSIKFNRGEGNNGAQSSITTPSSLTCSVLGLNISNINSVNFSSNNPFYDEITGEISFAAHAKKYNVSGPDIAACLLTWNGANPQYNFDNHIAIEGHISNATKLLTTLHSEYPNCKVLCLGIQISDLNGGCGLAYGATGNYSDTYATAFYAFEYNKALEQLCKSDPFKEFCYYVDIKGQFDSRYNMPANYRAVNTRNTGIKELIGTNGLHPYQTVPHEPYDTGSSGYFQIGDAFYRALTKVIPIVKQIKESNITETNE